MRFFGSMVFIIIISISEAAFAQGGADTGNTL